MMSHGPPSANLSFKPMTNIDTKKGPQKNIGTSSEMSSVFNHEHILKISFFIQL